MHGKSLSPEDVLGAFADAGFLHKEPARDEPPSYTEIPEWVNGEPDHAPATPSPPEIADLPPLTLVEWRARDLPEPDLIMGHWLSTTTRALMTAATGLGKTNFAVAL